MSLEINQSLASQPTRTQNGSHLHFQIIHPTNERRDFEQNEGLIAKSNVMKIKTL